MDIDVNINYPADGGSISKPVKITISQDMIYKIVDAIVGTKVVPAVKEKPWIKYYNENGWLTVQGKVVMIDSKDDGDSRIHTVVFRENKK